MNKLNEKRIDTVRLTNSQKKLMARVLNAPTPQRKSDEAANGEEMVLARKTLVKLGLLSYNLSAAKVTSDGKVVMRNANLIDENGDLTKEGNLLVKNEDVALESVFREVNNMANML